MVYKNRAPKIGGAAMMWLTWNLAWCHFVCVLKIESGIVTAVRAGSAASVEAINGFVERVFQVSFGFTAHDDGNFSGNHDVSPK